MLLRPVCWLGLIAVVLGGSAVPPTVRAQTPIRNPANDHYYALIVLPTPISWHDASDAARNSRYRGRPGYLATVTSAQENNFLRAHVYTDSALPPGYSIWLGGFRLPASPASPASRSPKSGWRWVSGEPWAFTYWANGEPNNAGKGEGARDKKDAAPHKDSGENRLIADGPRSYTWNDLRDNSGQEAYHVDILAYVVEYGRVIIPAPKKRIARNRRTGKPAVVPTAGTRRVPGGSLVSTAF